jgi:hypothetical protein
MEGVVGRFLLLGYFAPPPCRSGFILERFRVRLIDDIHDALGFPFETAAPFKRGRNHLRLKVAKISNWYGYCQEM